MSTTTRRPNILTALAALCFAVALAPAAGVAAEQSAGASLSIPRQGEAQFVPTADEGRVPALFRQQAHSFGYETELLGAKTGFRIFRVRFPSPLKSEVDENNTVHALYFQPEGPGPHPGTVVLHVLDGGFTLSELVAGTLATKGIATLFIKMPYYGERAGNSSRQMIEPDSEHTRQGMTQAVLDIRRAAAWLTSRPEVDSRRLGVAGISLGGIMSALSAAAEPRFRKVAVYLGGGKLGEIVWAHPHPHAVRFRRDWLSAGGTRESFLKFAAPFDPVTWGHLLEDRDVLMVAANRDEIFPRSSTLALWQAIGKKPELIWLDAGHITAVKYLFQELDRLGRFFQPAEEAR